MMFSKSCEYAIKAAIYIFMVTKDGSRIGLKQIAVEIDSPESFIAKILQTLVRQGIILSMKGPGGGFYIDPGAKSIPVIKIIEAMDGKHAFDRCGLGLKVCSDSRPCPIHNEFKGYSQRLKNLLMTKSVQELAESITSGRAYLSD